MSEQIKDIFGSFGYEFIQAHPSLSRVISPLFKALMVRIFNSLRIVRFIKSLALLREVRATTHRAVCSVSSLVVPPVIAADTTLCYIQSSVRDLLLGLLRY